MIRRRCATVAAAFVAAVATIPALATPASAAEDDLSVTITSLSPTTLGDRGTVRMSGTVTNRGDRPWSAVQAYLVVRPTPIASRAELGEQADQPGFTGSRIIDAGRFDELGTVPAGGSTPFSISIPAGRLPVSAGEGVLPIGVQILGTDPDGERSTESAARATTFLPRITGSHPASPTTVVWPLLMPGDGSGVRGTDGTFEDAESLLAQMATGGRLRNLLDQAAASDPRLRGVVVDPALVAAAADLADGRGASGDVSQADRVVARTFLRDLVEQGSGESAWVLDYDRTDVLSAAGADAGSRLLFSAVERATDAIATTHGLSAKRVSWPTVNGFSDDLTRQLRERGDDPVMVDSTSLADWTQTQGPLVRRSTESGDVPLLVIDRLTRDLPGAATATTLRQTVLAGAALAALDRDRDPASSAASVVVVDPESDPGTDPRPVDVVDTDYVQPRALGSIEADRAYDGALPESTTATTLGVDQLDSAVESARVADLLSAAAVDSKDFDDLQARRIADVLGVRWRSAPESGATAALALRRSLQADLSGVTISGPSSVTLSSSAGAFPITISNGSDVPMSVGVTLESSNPALDLPDQRPTEIAAGERETITVDVDLGQQTATTVTARLTSPDGRTFGDSSVFNVRSSSVGVVLWSTMALAGLLVLVALVRRFRRRGRVRAAQVAVAEPIIGTGDPDA